MVLMLLGAIGEGVAVTVMGRWLGVPGSHRCRCYRVLHGAVPAENKFQFLFSVVTSALLTLFVATR